MYGLLVFKTSHCCEPSPRLLCAKKNDVIFCLACEMISDKEEEATFRNKTPVPPPFPSHRPTHHSIHNTSRVKSEGVIGIYEHCLFLFCRRKAAPLHHRYPPRVRILRLRSSSPRRRLLRSPRRGERTAARFLFFVKKINGTDEEKEKFISTRAFFSRQYGTMIIAHTHPRETLTGPPFPRISSLACAHCRTSVESVRSAVVDVTRLAPRLVASTKAHLLSLSRSAPPPPPPTHRRR